MPELTIDTVTLGLIWFVAFLFSTTCHEGAHALVAKLGGDPTATQQITLNPLPHIQRELFGMVVIPFLSYFWGGWMMGWASAPYDAHWAYRHPHRAARMALAGPATNFSLAILAALGIRIGVAFEVFRPPSSLNAMDFHRIAEAVDPAGIGALFATVLSILFMLNFILGTFNLLPVPPLDGNMGVTILMSEERARSFLDLFRAPGLTIMGLLVAWMAFSRAFHYVFLFALNMLYYPITSYG